MTKHDELMTKIHNLNTLPYFYEQFKKMGDDYFNALIQTGVLNRPVPLSIIRFWAGEIKNLSMGEWVLAIKQFNANISQFKKNQYVQQFNEFTKGLKNDG